MFSTTWSRSKNELCRLSLSLSNNHTNRKVAAVTSMVSAIGYGNPKTTQYRNKKYFKLTTLTIIVRKGRENF